MTGKKPFFQQVDGWAIWFRLLGVELEKHPAGATSEEIAEAVMQLRGLSSDDLETVKNEANSVGRLLGDFSTWGLVSGEIVTRPVPGAAEKAAEIQELAARSKSTRIQPPPLFMTVPALVAQLTQRGTRLLGAPRWRQQFFFAHRLISDFKIWKPLQTALAVSGGLVTVLKMVLLWQSQHVAIVAGVGAAVAFALQLLRARDT